MLSDQSHLFDVPEGVTFLNTAYMGPRLLSVAAAATEAVALTGRGWDVRPHMFFDPVERLRQSVALALNGDADGVALIPAVSYGAGTAAANLPIGDGRTVVTVAEQFPSNIYPWRASVERDGGEVIVVARSEAGWTEPILEAIDESTAVVAVPNSHWTDGTLVDLNAVGKRAKEVGAALCVDASQSFGAYPLDVAAIDPDFVYSTGYKWQLGFYGLGYLWVAPRHRSGIPLEQGWAVRKDAENFAGLVDYTDVYEPGARRFDMGERSNFVGVAMNNAAMDQINAWGVDSVAETLRARTDAIAEGASTVGYESGSPSVRAGHMIGLRRRDGLPADIGDRLARENVYVSIRGDSIRVSPHLHTSDEDVERLLAVLSAG